MSRNSSDNKVYKAFWYCVAVFLCVTVVSCARFEMDRVEKRATTEQFKYQSISNTNATISALIVQGGVPKDVSCAVLIGNGLADIETKLYCGSK